MPEKPQHPDRTRAPQVERDDRDEGSVNGAARHDKAPSALAEMTPPQCCPFPGRKDVFARECKPLPVVANRIELFDDFGLQCGLVHDRLIRMSPNTLSTSDVNDGGRLPSTEACSRRKKR